MKNNKKNILPAVAGVVVVAALVITLVGKEKREEEERLAANEYYKEFSSNYGSQDDEFSAGIIPGIIPGNSGGTSNEAESGSNKEVVATLNEKGDLVINTGDITEEATFFQINHKGTDMAVLAVKADDGTIRTAFDTCQICNGSPYAYFEQSGDKFQCQNCGNVYSRDMLEKERGGCNPVPIMAEEKTVTDSEIIIPVEVLEANAERFENWKKF